MARNLKIILAILAVAVLVGLISLRSLRVHLARLSQNQKTEEKARLEVLAPPISTPTDVTVSANIFWAAGPGSVAPVVVQLPLSADPVQRAKQVLHALIANPPTPQQRTLPADTQVLAFYVLPDGTAVADFSDTLSSETPSGIVSEGIAVDSIAQTLSSNVSQLRRLKILIHGQEVETLAGHVDLTGFFDLSAPTPTQVSQTQTAPNPTPSTAPPAANPSTVAPATGVVTAPKPKN